MGTQPSSRKDSFGTEGIGEDGGDVGRRGHASQGGTARTRSGGTRGSDASEADRVRERIDRGETGDKVGVSDPAAAPLGTDEEAAGGHDEEGLRQARRAPPPRLSRR